MLWWAAGLSPSLVKLFKTFQIFSLCKLFFELVFHYLKDLEDILNSFKNFEDEKQSWSSNEVDLKHP